MKPGACAPTDLIPRARAFAVGAHARIGHLRKYHGLPYATHLENVAALVASVTGDPETIAAAWLHDVVEDTPATLEDVERSFGRRVAALVESLTDVSRPRDGNRAARKEIDRRHLAAADPKAKTIKLADLVDNCRDICASDQRFAPVYLREMARLLEVLQEGDAGLYRQALEAHRDCARRLDMQPLAEVPPAPPRQVIWNRGAVPLHVVRHYTESFTALDVADPLRSFDAGQDGAEVRRVMMEDALEIVCLRERGLARGYARRDDLGPGPCTAQLRAFRPGQVVAADEPLTEVVRVLTLHEHAFASLLGEVVGSIDRAAIGKPIARMWLFGIITLTELELVRLIAESFPGDSWRAQVSPGRLQKAEALQQERQRRGQRAGLVDCLQFSDKAQLLMEKAEVRDLFGFPSKRAAVDAVKQLESLRNNLAHAQDIVTHDWAAIARVASRIEEAARAKPYGRIQALPTTT